MVDEPGHREQPANVSSLAFAATLPVSEQLLRELIERLPQMIWIADSSGRCEYLSAHWVAYTGRPVAALLGLGWLDALHPESYAEVTRDWDNSVRTPREVKRVLRFRRHDGVYRWFDMRAVPVVDAEGHLCKWIGSHTDITDACEAQQALRAQKDFLDKLAATSPSVMYSFRRGRDGRTSFPYAAPTIFDLFGFTPEQLQQDAHVLAMAGVMEGAGEAFLALNESERTLTSWRVEFPVTHHVTKRRLWIEGHSQPVREPDGSVVWHGVFTDITQRKQMDAELRTERHRFERISAAVPGTIWVIRIADGSTRYEYLGTNAEELFGLPREVMMQGISSIEELIHAEDRPVLLEVARQSLQQCIPFRFIYRLNHPTRGLIWLETCGSVPDVLAPGDMRWHGYITEVTPRVHAEQALRETEERFSVAFHSSPVGHILIRRNDAVVVEVNEALLRLIGYTRDEVVGQRGPGLPVTDIDAPACTLGKALLEQSGRQEKELRFVRRDGTVIHALLALEPVIIAGQSYALSSLADITERKAAEEALRDYRARLLTALESGGMSTWACDLTGEHLWWDDAAPKLWGRKREELVGQSLAGLQSFVYAEDRLQVARIFAPRMADQRNLRVEFRNERPDGSLQWMSMRAHVERDEGGAPYRMIGVCVDIDARKRAEESQLSSQKMEALGTLAGGIAHDFNNVLLAIGGNAQLALAELPADHPALPSLREIQKASERATDLVRRILTFSRHQEVKREALNIRPVVDEALGLLRPALPAMIQIRFLAGSDLPCAMVNSTQVHQIVINLVTNAAHAIGNCAGSIDIRLDNVIIDSQLASNSVDLHPGRYVRLSVADTGSGMDKAIMSRIFDPFFTTKPLGQGTGLGLAVVHGIVKAYEGAITVSSEPGAGTSFCIFLPEAQQAAPVALSIAPVVQGSCGERVLYVDDDEAIVFLMDRLLRRQGYELQSFTDATEALAVFRVDPHRFDVIVTDLAMPAMSGFDLTREVQRICPDMPVVMTSGYVRPEDQVTARELGVRELILKPNTVEQLGATLDRIFKELRQSGNPQSVRVVN